MVECESVCCKREIRQCYSFNRYMVECESLSVRDYQNLLYRFNRYMVECECAITEKGVATESTGFNRYMVECEYLDVWYKTIIKKF